MRELSLTLCVALAVAGCAPKPDPVNYRTRPGTIGSAALFDPGRFQGDWHVVAAFGSEAACAGQRESWAADGPGRFVVRAIGCTPQGARTFASRAVLTGPGRISRVGLAGGEEFWVLWVDADYRIAAIGAPSGRFGRIMARENPPRADLLRAAEQILDFNGYDISALHPVPKGP